MIKNKLPAFLIMFGAGLWGTMSIFVRKMSAMGYSPMQSTFFRCAITFIVLLLYFVFFDRKKLRINFKDVWYFFGTGILSFSLMGYFYFTTITLTTASVAAILLYTSPFFVLLMSAVFFKERITRRKLVAFILAVAGCVAVTGFDFSGDVSAKSLFFGIMSGFTYALYSIFGTVALKKYPPVTITVYTFLFASIGCFFMAEPSELAAKITLWQMPFLILFALTTAFFPYLLYTIGLKKTEAGKAAILATTEPMTATLVGIFVFSEIPSFSAILGIFLILSAGIILNSGDKKIKNTKRDT